MARGWESKNVDEQQGERAAGTAAAAARSTAIRETADRVRRRQELELMREQILNQRTSNAGRRAALAAALAQVEGELEELLRGGGAGYKPRPGIAE